MAAGGQIEAHEGIAGLQQRQEHRLVHLAAGIRLHVGEPRAEQFLRALDRQRFRDVDPFAAAVVAGAGIAFRVFVGHHRALRFQHGAADDVFGRDQLDLVALPAEFTLDRGGDFRIGLGQRRGEEGIGRGSGVGAGGGRAALGIGEYLHRRKPEKRPGAVGHVWRSKERLRDTTLHRPGQAVAVPASYLCKIWWGWRGLPTVGTGMAGRAHSRTSERPVIPAKAGIQ